MKTVYEAARHIPVVREVDVLVVGGGPAGFTAAAAAARHGARTVLLERYGYLGGLASGGLVLYMDALADKSGQRVIGGLPWKVLERCRRMGGTAEDGPLAIHVDSEILKVAADQVCMEAGVELRLHSWAAAAYVQGNAVRGVIAESKAGREAILCKVCIDATGDGDIAALAGVPCDVRTQRIGLNLKLGGIDRQRFSDYQREHADELRAHIAELRAMGGHALWPGLTPYSQAGVYWINILGLAHRNQPDIRSVAEHVDEAVANFAGGLSSLSVEDLTFCETTLRRQLLMSVEYYRQHIPGFEHVMLLSFATQLGVRDSRRIHGLHQLTKAEMNAGRAPADAIGRAGCGFCQAPYYEVSYGCLVPGARDGLLVAGRCISADDYAQQAVRLIPPAMMTGQAAGTAAALAARRGIEPRTVDTGELRALLAADDVIL